LGSTAAKRRRDRVSATGQRRLMFALSDSAIDASALTRGLANDGAGACVTLEGRVRNNNAGRAVHALDYQAYGALAVKEGEKILGEAKEKFAILDARCVHRVG